MNPQVAGKKYARTAVCVINGVFNTIWDTEAAKNNPKAYFKSTPQTNFRKANQEDHLCFAITKYTNGVKVKNARQTQSRAGDNKPNIPTTTLLNGLEGNHRGEVQDQIQVLGVHMGEGAIQAGGSGRTANLEEASFYPGALLGGFVPERKDGGKGEDNMYLVPREIDPKEKKCPLLDRGRMLGALDWLHEHDSENGRAAFPLNGTILTVPGNRGQPTHPVKVLLHSVFNMVLLTIGSGAAIDDNGPRIEAIAKARELIEKYIDKPVETDIGPVGVEIITIVNPLLKGLHIAYVSDVRGKSSNYSKAIIEPFEKFVMDQIEEKLNIMRQVFGVVVAPVSADTKWIPFNFCGYSR
jgi:hypothetical protein